MSVLRAAICATLLLAALAASPALAAFPGRNGLLAVAPLQGAGVMVMSSRGAGQHRVCPTGVACPVVRLERWSPDGQAIVFSARAAQAQGFSSPDGQGTSVIYDDGSCLDCQPFGGSRPAFTSNPALLSTVSGGDLIEFGSDGLQKRTVLSGGVSDAVWSARGRLAVVRAGRVLAGKLGHLQSLGPGSDPSWAPGGSRLAVTRRGWVTLLGVGHHSVKRLAKGTVPAFSPDGKWIAFIGAGHRLSIASSGGGRLRHVASIRGRYVDWQPITATPPSCAAPPGSTTVASSSTAIVTADTASVAEQSYPLHAYMGCLHSVGRERLLVRYDHQDVFGSVTAGSDFVTAGTFAALVENADYPHYGAWSVTARVFDLNTGSESPTLGGEHVGCPGMSICGAQQDQLAMNADGFTAAHTSVVQIDSTGTGGQQVTEQIVASDSTGVHVEDTATRTYSYETPAPSLLANLQLIGNTLTWEHSGSPRRAQLN